MNVIGAILADHPLFKSMNPQHLDILASCGREQQFLPGELLLRQGAPATEFFLVLEGTVRIESHDLQREDTLLHELGAGDIVGWSWLFAPFVNHFQARADGVVRAAAFDGAHLLIACERDAELGHDLMRRIAQVVIHRLHATRQGYVNLLRRRVEPAAASLVGCVP